MVLAEISALKKELTNQVIILGHHYQQDDIIRFADVIGDSLYLSQQAAKTDRPYVLFCGVHFMAEAADMLTADFQKVILPDLNAGCSMADMARRADVEVCWQSIQSVTSKKIIPITYINCAAELKAFVGEHEGCICTSSNAKKIISWALSQGEKLLFFPDQHLGRITCYELGIKLEEMIVYDPNKKNGGVTKEEIAKAKVILWYGYCSVHQGFSAEQIAFMRQTHPGIKIAVHSECNFEVVSQADVHGSTSLIIDAIKAAPSGTTFAVGTEVNLVNRLAKKFTDKTILSLSPYQCICSTMYRVRPRWLLASLRAIKENKPINVITVEKNIKDMANIALNRMLKLS
ncbi:MAG: quinolinate synthetase [Bdellovibrionales bacterium RIFOXYD12_FULL_39_22]|nr:MAG: quinolinate synthetase [Bdellovibrionales bacterium RIFOXYB1_FULL_39_21]OFZ42152.1 MAG: quinolinate synthetase [Bdellovibrionales bacterium RIFOXYC12_FULL_39_17]OFZ50973.1 MAG: quinolinate synthetase [Bdellovibrionales bacterium RIFOXYC1_FULL_39_130]OFZ78196.1 MAG: quinolinate synthetase [Bdellovibrionales bacterium RIFOXYD1_FULL_39_84]OFZ93816.1 MAG: quinolinate synthetase [Bdellovibrionales bacterium RIFOXYD12_FULL_39_22]